MKILLVIALAFTLACSTSKKKDSGTPAAPVPAKAGTETSAKATPSSDKNKASKEVHCQKDSDQRTLTIESTAKGHELMYVKFGKSSMTASGSIKHCTDVMEKITKKLEESGYTCK